MGRREVFIIAEDRAGSGECKKKPPPDRERGFILAYSDCRKVSRSLFS
jgi:hypothetical protein